MSRTDGTGAAPPHDAVVFDALANRRNHGVDEDAIRSFVRWRLPKSTAAEDLRALEGMAAQALATKVGQRWFLTPAGHRRARGSAQKATWEPHDAWILLALLLVSRGDPVALSRIINAADYINHAVPTREELHGALNRLAAGRLLRTTKGLFAPTPRAIEVLQRVQAACGTVTLRQLDGLARLMGCPSCGVPLATVRWKIPLGEQEWEAARREAAGVS